MSWGDDIRDNLSGNKKPAGKPLFGYGQQVGADKLGIQAPDRFSGNAGAHTETDWLNRPVE